MRIADPYRRRAHGGGADDEASPRTCARSAPGLATAREVDVIGAAGTACGDAASAADRVRQQRCARFQCRGRCAADGQQSPGTPGRLRVRARNKRRPTLGHLSDERATATWRLAAGSRELFAAPRAAVLRSFLFNHWYHHRGQLLVYLRLLDVPVPSVYGPTADENPFGA